MLIFVIVLVMDVGEGLNYTRSKIMCNACLLFLWRDVEVWRRKICIGSTSGCEIAHDTKSNFCQRILCCDRLIIIWSLMHNEQTVTQRSIFLSKSLVVNSIICKWSSLPKEPICRSRKSLFRFLSHSSPRLMGLEWLKVMLGPFRKFLSLIATQYIKPAISPKI